MIENNAKSLAIILPCFNEAEVIPKTAVILESLLSDMISQKKVAKNSYLLFIDDGSTDSTWTTIENLAKKSYHFRGIKLTRNVGHQNALLSGLVNSDSDMTISLDVDLQDDVKLIPEMVDKYSEGYEVVFGVRKGRVVDSFLKRNSARCFYKIISKMGVNQIENHADFRLMGRKSISALKKYSESHLYLRGIIPQLGFNSTKLYYERSERKQGSSKYPLVKMISLALTGITSMSVTPLRMISAFGFFISICSFIGGVHAIYAKFVYDTVDGWTSLMTAIFFLGGVQLLAIGIIGEYIGRTYIEVKKRPNYVIELATDGSKYV